MISESKNSNIFDSEATVIGQCGDSITTRLIVRDNIISDIEQSHSGCGYTAACAAMTSYIAKNLSLEEALEISYKMVIERIINLPEDHFHCAKLAINSLGEAISRYYSQKNK